jgi:hypothetical protein
VGVMPRGGHSVDGTASTPANITYWGCCSSAWRERWTSPGPGQAGSVAVRGTEPDSSTTTEHMLGYRGLPSTPPVLHRGRDEVTWGEWPEIPEGRGEATHARGWAFEGWGAIPAVEESSTRPRLHAQSAFPSWWM